MSDTATDMYPGLAGIWVCEGLVRYMVSAVPSIRWALLDGSSQREGQPGTEAVEALLWASSSWLLSDVLGRRRRGKGKEYFLFRAMMAEEGGCGHKKIGWLFSACVPWLDQGRGHAIQQRVRDGARSKESRVQVCGGKALRSQVLRRRGRPVNGLLAGAHVWCCGGRSGSTCGLYVGCVCCHDKRRRYVVEGWAGLGWGLIEGRVEKGPKGSAAGPYAMHAELPFLQKRRLRALTA